MDFLPAVKLCNSYTMACPPACGDNSRALASGLSYVQVDKHGITILCHLHQCRSGTLRDIRAQLGKGGMKHLNSHANEQVYPADESSSFIA